MKLFNIAHQCYIEELLEQKYLSLVFCNPCLNNNVLYMRSFELEFFSYLLRPINLKCGDRSTLWIASLSITEKGNNCFSEKFNCRLQITNNIQIKKHFGLQTVLMLMQPYESSYPTIFCMFWHHITLHWPISECWEPQINKNLFISHLSTDYRKLSGTFTWKFLNILFSDYLSKVPLMCQKRIFYQKL